MGVEVRRWGREGWGGERRRWGGDGEGQGGEKRVGRGGEGRWGEGWEGRRWGDDGERWGRGKRMRRGWEEVMGRWGGEGKGRRGVGRGGDGEMRTGGEGKECGTAQKCNVTYTVSYTEASILNRCVLVGCTSRMSTVSHTHRQVPNGKCHSSI